MKINSFKYIYIILRYSFNSTLKFKQEDGQLMLGEVKIFYIFELTISDSL